MPLAVIQSSSALSMYVKWGVAQLHSYVGHNYLSWSGTFNVFLSHSGKLFANANTCSFLHAALWFSQQGRNEGARGGRNYPGAESLWGRQKIPTLSHVHSSIQYICFRKTSGSKIGAPNLHLGPSAIWPRYAHVNPEINFIKKPIHSLLCCKTTMQTNCGLTNCTGNSWSWFFVFILEACKILCQ